MIPSPPIDFAAVARRADLRGIIERDLGAAHVIGGVPYWRCPFHGGESLKLYLYDSGRRWRCWPCNLTGDALDYLTRREGIGVVEAAALLDPSIEPGRPADRKARRPTRRPEPPPREPEPEPAWWDPHWQAAVCGLVGLAEESLWSDKGRPALEWLRGRGLDDHTIRLHRLGYLPAEGWTAPVPRPDGTVAGIRYERGVLIPWPAPIEGDGRDQRLVGANVHRFDRAPDDKRKGPGKYKALWGSTRGYLYPFAEILPTQGRLPVLLVEGEIDALIGWQEVGHVLHVGTVGGASQAPHPTALDALERCPWWLLGFDHDEPGVKAAQRWKARAPQKSRRTQLPYGKDLGEFHQAGGDVREWISDELIRLNLEMKPCR